MNYNNKYHVAISAEFWLTKHPLFPYLEPKEQREIQLATAKEIEEALRGSGPVTLFSNDQIRIYPISIPEPRMRIIRSIGKAFKI